MWLNSRAALPLDVKIEVALAFGWRSMTRIASSRLATGQTEATGPKISSRPMTISGATPSKTLGPMK